MGDAVQRIEMMRDPKGLVPYERNNRKHSKDAVAKLARAMTELAVTNAIVVDEADVIIAGHRRQLAAIHAGIDSYPVVKLTGLSDAVKRALRIEDNRLDEDSPFDFDNLKLELLDLQAMEFDLTLTGFEDHELADLMKVGDGELLGDADEEEAVGSGEPVNMLGDLWELGEHRLICGDSTSAEVVSKVLGQVKPGLMVTDPPYGVNYDPAKRAKGLNDGADRALGQVMNDDRADWREAWALFPGDMVYVWHAYKTASLVEESLRASGFEMRAQIIWRKPRATLSPGNINPKTMGYNSQHEAAWYCVRKGSRASWRGDRSQSTVWDIGNVKNETGHGTQKPLECMKRPIENNSSAGQAVYDPFAGSGTTIIAAEVTGRIAFAVELDPVYCDVIIGRFQRLTGKTAIHVETGLTFAEVLAKRNPSATLSTKIAKPKPAKKPRGTP